MVPRPSLPGAVVSTAVVPPVRVYVCPTGPTAELWPFMTGWITHRRMLGATVMSVTVALSNGVSLVNCDPFWITLVGNRATELDIPPFPGATPC